jgi:hypothetical protein
MCVGNNEYMKSFWPSSSNNICLARIYYELDENYTEMKYGDVE